MNRLRRAGVPREAAMRLVNCASDLVHQVHQREKVDDVVRWRDAASFPSLSEEEAQLPSPRVRLGRLSGPRSRGAQLRSMNRWETSWIRFLLGYPRETQQVSNLASCLRKTFSDAPDGNLLELEARVGIALIVSDLRG